MTSMKVVLALACGIVPVAALNGQAPPAVAIQQAAVSDPGHPSISLVIWTPSEAKAGTAAARKLPLIVISHGTGADPISHADTAHALAEAGFVVAAPMHPGDNFQDDSDVGKQEWFQNRARHVGKVIDFMLGQWPGHERLDPRRIGIFGFSAGATTALIAIGGEPDLDRAVDHCARAHEFACDLLKPRAAAAAPPVWLHDERIGAAVIAAPGLGFAFEPSGLRKVHVPVQLWIGAEDQTVPDATNSEVVRRLLPAAPDVHRVGGAVHLSFLAPCQADTPPFLCRDRPGFDRVAFHRSLNQAVIAYFREQLPR